MKIKKAVLFDFDGTIVDSQELYDLAASETLKKINPKYTLEFCSHYFHGRGWKDVFAETQKLEPKHDVKRAFQDALSLARRLVHKGLKPTEHAREVLSKLKDDGIKMAICSNSHKKTIIEYLDLANLSSYFEMDKIFGVESVKNAKPAPDIYLKAARHLGTKKDECIVIEDSMAGIRSACFAGIEVLLYTGASHHIKNPNLIKNMMIEINDMNQHTMVGVVPDLLEIYNFLK